MIGPRKDRLSWDDTFMLMALVMAQRSADPNTQVGAIITDEENRLVSAGYNGPPKGIHPKRISWAREGKPEDTKYARIIHAEINAIHNAKRHDLSKCKAYITLYPCNTCAASMIQEGIQEIIYLDDKYINTWFSQVATEMLDIVDVKVRKHRWSSNATQIAATLLSQVLQWKSNPSIL